MKAGLTTRQTNKGWLKKLRQRYRNNNVVAVGFPISKTGGLAYPDGTPLINVAVWNNFGTRTAPRRDFMTLGGQLSVKATKKLREKLVTQVNAGTIDPKGALAILGPVVEAQYQKAIVDLSDPPNAPFTVSQKGSSNPLVDTGQMAQSVTHVVREKN